MSRTDRPCTHPAITRLSTALVRVTPWPRSRDAHAAVVPRSFGRCRVTGPDVVSIVNALHPLRDPSVASLVSFRRW